MSLEQISAVTLAVRDMVRSVKFYTTIGCEILYGGESASFTNFRIGGGHLNLILSESGPAGWWGRVIFWVSDVDEVYRKLRGQGMEPDVPRDAEWGERFFHIVDPDGHELSFAKPLSRPK